MSIIEAIIIAIVEGLTEFLPVSSTGHMIIASSFLGIHKEEFTKLFEVAIQLGAILAVVVLYWKKFFDFRRWQFYVKLIIGEPYAVTGIKAVDEKWFPGFNEYRAAAKEIAELFDAVFIPYHAIYDNARKEAPGVYWTHDGVHPTLAGTNLMAHAWIEAVKAK